MRNLRVGNAFRERIQTVRPVGAADAVRQARRKARREPRIPRPEKGHDDRRFGSRRIG